VSTKLALLKRFIAEALVFEDAETSSPENTKGGVSLDAQVDKYFIEYEGDAKTAKKEGRWPVGKNLFEAEGDDSEEKPEESPAPPSKLDISAIDMETFANSVVRLIENYDSLLEVRSTIQLRAADFLKKSYDDDTLKEFDRIMREDHGMEPGVSKEEMADEQFPAPAADRAGDGGGGA
jgi:hypothetical protein